MPFVSLSSGRVVAFVLPTLSSPRGLLCTALLYFGVQFGGVTAWHTRTAFAANLLYMVALTYCSTASGKFGYRETNGGSSPFDIQPGQFVCHVLVLR